jgi:hypothetical protein
VKYDKDLTFRVARHRYRYVTRVAYQYLTCTLQAQAQTRVAYHHNQSQSQDNIYKYFSINPLTLPKSSASTLFPFPSIVSAMHTAL